MADEFKLLYSGVQINDALNKTLNTNLPSVITKVNLHVAGTNDIHSASEINNNSDISGTKVKDALNNSNTRTNQHVAGTHELHLASHITNNSGIAGVKVSNALDNLKTIVDAAVIGGDANAFIGLFVISDIGTTNTYVGNFSGQAIFPDMVVLLIPNNTNTSACTFNYNSGGAIAIKKISGGNKVDPFPTDIKKKEGIFIRYDGTDWVIVKVDTNLFNLQQYSYDISGNLEAILYKDLSNNTLRTDTFSYAENIELSTQTITEVRSIVGGEVTTIVTTFDLNGNILNVTNVLS